MSRRPLLATLLALAVISPPAVIASAAASWSLAGRSRDAPPPVAVATSVEILAGAGASALWSGEAVGTR